ncbi:MGMT family protein [Nocardioides sp. TRM66260-LWL]|uniref:MGMT family protein n=1 Tax=Nocardioides sp. TRM66260-LWL TaxID=2874478 RepID=UPI001CC5C7D3|nr:MGMT family protein [Nocardioides sp. TRM66260-LWL]MBZ5734173.1 MGMT family protein [Nocardioides sp. TRM66260-LWL]
MRHPDDYLEAVLATVESVPPGRVTTYGAVARAVGRFGPRRVGAVLAEHGGGVPWWRVVRADGSVPPPLRARARVEHLAEGTPLRASGAVDLARALWTPEAPKAPEPDVAEG